MLRRRLGGVSGPLRRPGHGPGAGGRCGRAGGRLIIDSPERWMALDYTANTVRLLLLKMGRYVTQ